MLDADTEIIAPVTSLLPPVEYAEPPRPRPRLAGDPVLRAAVRVMAWTVALGFAAVVLEALIWLRPAG